MSGTAVDYLLVAERELGTTEVPPGSNRTKYGEWFGHNGVAWCAIFQSWVFDQIGLPEFRSAWCDDWVAKAKSGEWGTWMDPWVDLQPGDLAIFDWDGGFSDHIAGVSQPRVGSSGSGQWVSIEGNWANSVTRVTRGRGNIRGFIRPKWDIGTYHSATEPFRVGPAEVQRLLNTWAGTAGHRFVTVDGIIGPRTIEATRAFQTFANNLGRYLGTHVDLVVDGIAGPKTIDALQRWSRAVNSPAWTRLPIPNPTLTVGSPSGDPVRMLQTLLNRVVNGRGRGVIAPLTVDGIYGRLTRGVVRYFQSLEGLTVDGIYGPNTRAAIARYA